MAKVNHLSLQNRYHICREYTELWQTYFHFFSEELEDVVISDEMEMEFQNIMNVLALNHFKFSELCGVYMKDPMDILETMSQTPSLRTLQGLTESSLSKLMVEWHTTFIEMNKAMGKILSRMSPKELEAIQGGDAQPAEA